MSAFDDMFLTLQRTISPLAESFTAEQRQASLVLFHQQLAARPPSVRKKLGLFFFFINVASWIFCFGRFVRLAPDARERVLRMFFDSPVGLFRKGYWGVATLAKMGVYGQLAMYPSFGYPTPGPRP